MKRPIHFITRQKEWDLLQILMLNVDCSNFNSSDTGVLMVSPDYSATVAMHLAHAWSKDGKMIDIIPVEVPYPNPVNTPTTPMCQMQLRNLVGNRLTKYRKLVLVEAGVISGKNYQWILEELYACGRYTKKNVTTVALCESVNSITKSDYVAEYYDDQKEELAFYYERFNINW